MDAGSGTEHRGEEFRDDLRPARAVGSGNTAARRILSADELAPLTRLNDVRSAGAVALSVGVIGAAVAFGVAQWGTAWVLLSVLVIGVQQHGLFILAHESAHYRLFSRRGLNDAVGRLIGMASGISTLTRRCIPVMPMPRAASTTGAGRVVRPVSVFSKIGRSP